MDWQERIEVNPKILLGKPVIKGTRLSVEFLLKLLAERWTHEQILYSYSHLSPEDLRAVLSFADDPRERDRFLPTTD